MTRLTVDGGEIEYWRQGDGPAVVFVHGSGSPGSFWTEDLRELADAATLVTYDRRGYGGSSHSPRDWGAHTADALALLRALELAPAALIGYSAGSIVALQIALEHPELVSRVVLLDPAVYSRSNVTPGFLWMFAGLQLLRRLRGDRAAAERWYRYVWGPAWRRAPAERREIVLANASDGLFGDLAGGDGSAQVPEEGLARMRAPVTIIDAALSPPLLRKGSARLQRAMPAARAVTLERSGHAVALDDRPGLVAALREALRG